LERVAPLTSVRSGDPCRALTQSWPCFRFFGLVVCGGRAERRSERSYRAAERGARCQTVNPWPGRTVASGG